MTCAIACKFHLSGRKLDETAPHRCQGRVESGRALSARRLHRDEHVEAIRECRGLLQQTRHVRTMDQGGKGCDPMDTAVMPRSPPTPSAFSSMRSPTISATSSARSETPEPIKDWSLTSLKDKLIKIGAKVVSHGRYVAFQMADRHSKEISSPTSCGSSRNCGRRPMRRPREVFGCHAFERSPRERCVWITTNSAFSALGAPMSRVGSTGAPCLRFGIAKILALDQSSLGGAISG